LHHHLLLEDAEVAGAFTGSRFVAVLNDEFVEVLPGARLRDRLAGALLGVRLGPGDARGFVLRLNVHDEDVLRPDRLRLTQDRLRSDFELRLFVAELHGRSLCECPSDPGWAARYRRAAR